MPETRKPRRRPLADRLPQFGRPPFTAPPVTTVLMKAARRLSKLASSATSRLRNR
ncbi:MAG: hypothetical protein QOJ35_2275 [Solirubrobacteraceae bacterium]|jgi:hypothetical protein|nr:hypothetical protein [Solirubrobacteraceae bacterium]